ncbi:hypothetical protein JCM8202_000495 [Rhodotorula sphaerocarpa]
MATAARPLLVDVHSHAYTPSYLALLRAREHPPRLVNGADGQERLVLSEREGEAAEASIPQGGPFRPQDWEREAKLRFMDNHGIDVSIVSLAEPWLDFLSPREAVETARRLNEELEEYCAAPSSTSKDASDPEPFQPLAKDRLFAFGILPLVPGVDRADVLAAVEQVRQASHLRGVIIGTRGCGKGLDDEELESVYRALSSAGLTAFIHPHGDLGAASGETDYGHALASGVDLPFETTKAAARLILSGVFDRHPDLKLLLAHSAGALPALSSRLASCISHDPRVKDRLQNDFRYYLGQLYYDAIAHGSEELALVERVISRADNFEGRDEELEYVERVVGRSDLLAPVGVYPGVERILFGTDHPCIPPQESDRSSRWVSVDDNLDAIGGVPGWGASERERVLGLNAVELFELDA